eukprot:TRINITY_DN11541_c0_g1_i1.p2 TRINITY_DN11541_c0_g1~~TRINITY_DN11541_c0_g1_i1.p2  ORF type:complete len:241 (+),score=84.53 TRINITY_DN11541_c0_g1_i1:72-725(+)
MSGEGTVKPIINIDVVSDNLCPWCFVGKRHLEEAITSYPDTQFNIKWKPFFLNPGASVEEPIKEHLLRKYGRNIPDLDSPSNPLNRAAAQAGIKFNQSRLVVNTLASHRLVFYAQRFGKQNEAIEAIFKAYFEGGENINRTNVLERIGNELGLPNVKEFLESEEGTNEVKHEYAEYSRRINGVPFFTITKDGARRKLALSGAQPADAFRDAFDELLS